MRFNPCYRCGFAGPPVTFVEQSKTKGTGDVFARSIFYHFKKYPMEAVTDGTSNTVIIGESATAPAISSNLIRGGVAVMTAEGADIASSRLNAYGGFGGGYLPE